jgi:flagellar hook protein FlgE
MSFQQGLSGLNGAQRSLDAISNNVANSGTVGFKLSQAQFADVYAAALGVGGSSQIGIGTTVVGVGQQFTQGNLSVTNNPLDVAINGAGFFRMNSGGVISYSRNGQFNIDKDGFIVNTSGDRLTGYAANAQGVILPSSPTDISVDTADLAPRTTTEARLGVNLDSRETPPTQTFDPVTKAPAESVTETTSMSVFDTLGNPHILTLHFIKLDAPNPTDPDYRLFVSLDDGPAISPHAPNALPATGTDLSFNSAGVLTTSMPLRPSFPITTGADPVLAFELDLTGSTQFGSGFGVNRLVQDGYAPGRLSGINISAEGVVQGRYSNGQSRDLGQIVLANFPNPNGLQSIGNNQWAESSESGQPLIGAPGTGSLGMLQSAAVEESNVDLTAELVNMITQQRAYQANAQSIKTQDQILQTLVNLR